MARKTFKKQITSPELTEKINPKNIKLMERFLKEKDTRSSSGTVEGYRSDAIIFLTWNLLYNDNKFFIDIKKIEFSEFFSYCVDELKWSSARFSRMRACLSSWSNFIEKFFDEDYPNFRNVILKAIESMPKNPVREKTILSDEQINNLLKYLSVELNEIQDACLLALAISSGARISELLRFTIDIIDVNNTAFDGLFLETGKQLKTKGRGKQGKLLYKYIIKDLFISYYEKWLIERKKIMIKNNKNHKFIFIKPNGDPAEESTVRSWIVKWEKYLGVPFYMHSLRHYIVTYMSRIGLSADLIIEIMGWSSSEMYKIYNDLSAKDREWKELEKLKESLKQNKE